MNFQELETRTIADLNAIAHYRVLIAPKSGWLVEAPAESLEVDEGKVGTVSAPLTDEEREAMRENGRCLDNKLIQLSRSSEAAPLVWVVEKGGGALAQRSISITQAVGRGMASKRQRDMWAHLGNAGHFEAAYGQLIWPPAVNLWCGLTNL